MTTISAQIIEDSISPYGVRLCSYQLRYPRWFHPELMTHRAFARNASSSRAIPVRTMLSRVLENPAEPIHLGLQEKGMQARAQITDPTARSAALGLWRRAMHEAVKSAGSLVDDCGLHKQIANRLTEPWQHMDVVLSATDFENFFALRCHPDAEPHFRVLAWRMADAYYGGSSPKPIALGDWHLPYVTAVERDSVPLESLKACSAARCARVSYKLHDGEAVSVEKDLELYKKLVTGLLAGTGDPGHMSPLEHQATPLDDPKAHSGPFRGWKQFRKEMVGENASFDYEAAVAKGWRASAYEILPT